MLEEIRIQNFAIIEKMNLSLSEGLNVITGETGAGKSIVIDAVELLLGGRADASVVRGGQDKAVIEGTFLLTAETGPLVRPVLQREDLLEDEHTVTITREIRKSGRTSARINGITVNQTVLREVGGFLVDIHGQSEHLSLLQPRGHINLLDRYAGLLDMREGISTLSDKLSGVRRQIKSLQDDKDELERRAERLRREIEEIEAADLQPDEDDDLKAERTRLANSEQLATLTGEAALLLNGDDDDAETLAAVDQLQQVAVILGKLAALDETLEEDAELADGIAAQAQELSLTLANYADDVEYNPARLNEVEERLEAINGLKRRYGLTIDIILEHAEKARADLDRIDNSDQALENLRQEEEKLLRLIGEAADNVSKARRKTGDELARRIITELGDLKMASARFEVSLIQKEDKNGCIIGKKRYAFDNHGIDTVEFMMSANPGEPMMPLAKVASGGETARIMLALKRALTIADPTGTLIFDEIDQGIGGRLGTVVGEKLWSLAAKHQVMVVTHLAQLAGYADAHFRVEKRVVNNRTTTHIHFLDGEDARTNELADMLGTVGDSGEQSARELLLQASLHKETLTAGGF